MQVNIFAKAAAASLSRHCHSSQGTDDISVFDRPGSIAIRVERVNQ
jgi:hypothetical protein